MGATRSTCRPRATISEAYQECSRRLREALDNETITLPDLALEHGHNTRQAMSYGFTNWRDFFNDRHLLAVWDGCVRRLPEYPTVRPAAHC